MAKRPNRYTEARVYMVGSSVGLLLIVWSILALKDRLPASGAADASTTEPTAAASTTTSSRSSSTTTKPTTKPQATAAPVATAKPQTRSHGS